MYGTIVYVRSPLWPEGQSVTLENVTQLETERNALNIKGLGSVGVQLQSGRPASVGLLLPDGSRHLIEGIFIGRRFGYGPEGPSWELGFAGCQTSSLPMHPHEAERRAYIAAEKDRQRLADLGMSEGQSEPSAEAVARMQRILGAVVADIVGEPPRPSNVAEKVREDFERGLMDLCDYDGSKDQSDQIDAILEMITTRIGMAREGL